MRIVLHLTTACNMKCSYCLSPQDERGGMDIKTGRKAMEFGANHSHGYCRVVFFGGEPLLRRNLLMELVFYGQYLQTQHGCVFHFQVTTNGAMLDEEFLDFASEHDIHIAMSFDGVREAHNLHRRFQNGSGTYGLLLQRLKMLLHCKPDSSVLLVVNPDTAGYLDASIQHLLELNCRSINIYPNYDASWGSEDFALLAEQYSRVADTYIKWTRLGHDFRLNPFDLKIMSRVNPCGYKATKCKYGQNEYSIDPLGNIYPCVQFNYAGPKGPWLLGNVFHGIDQDAIDRLRSASGQLDQTCRSCPFKDRCNNVCGCLNFQTTGSVNKVSPTVCKHEKILIPIVDRMYEELVNSL